MIYRTHKTTQQKKTQKLIKGDRKKVGLRPHESLPEGLTRPRPSTRVCKQSISQKVHERNEALKSREEINEKILACHRMLMNETIPFYRMELIKELHKLTGDYLHQSNIITKNQPSLKIKEIVEKQRHYQKSQKIQQILSQA